MPDNLPVPHHPQQSDADCMPICAQMVLDYWGKSMSRNELVRLLETDPDVGTPAARVLRLQPLEWSVQFQRAVENDLRQWLAQQIPIILLVDTGELPYWSRRCAHAVVLVGIQAETAYINDPAFDTAPLAVHWGDLQLAWDAMENLAIAIAPA